MSTRLIFQIERRRKYMKIPKKVLERFSKGVPKFKRILKKAYDKDLNESDTVSIIVDMLEQIFGFDKYEEVTSEYAIKGTYCDLAIKLDGKLKFLIEAKAIGVDLKSNHLNQALTYGAKEGIDWIILTNGIIWEVYRIQLKPNLEANLLNTLNFSDFSLRQKDAAESLYIISKEGQSKNAIDQFSLKADIINRYVLSAILTEENIINSIRLQARKLESNIRISNDEILEIIQDGVIKRDILEDDSYKKIKSKLKRARNKAKKQAKVKKEQIAQEA